MNKLELDVPYTDMTLLLDALRHYICHIEQLDENEVDDDTYADLMNDYESVKMLETELSIKFAKEFGEY
ncbi:MULTISPECIES: hypothetical protein [Vibrio harveyi group]|uniref:hypothetical protein n=1 Tax=Vibrio harveyi group TaxID=717610 RepID=UPI0015F5F385|nr:hypothetical protein [Vibrio diabolicus]HCE1840458.1 hypothetical protein [Vibrio parahaemolyticus]HCE4532191.1 hypothetical protein [Vibrio parahaemolyticus]HCG6962787.1 hypothetical protein [Vibrio parahaemolyticus]HCG7288940.1 hypothetical protein [Vibrio parahaemolyticus]HCM0793376.1 hypothetical protein [Vibrio parahaemolyticus]